MALVEGSEHLVLIWTDQKNLALSKRPASQVGVVFRPHQESLEKEKPILPSTSIVGSLTWEIERLTREAQQHELDLEMAKLLINHMFHFHGIPWDIVWDQGSLLGCARSLVWNWGPKSVCPLVSILRPTTRWRRLIRSWKLSSIV